MNAIEMPTGTLPLVCDHIGEGSAEVEITAFLPHPKVIEGLEQLIWPQSHNGMSINDFMQAVTASTLDQTTTNLRSCVYGCVGMCGCVNQLIIYDVGSVIYGLSCVCRCAVGRYCCGEG